MSRVGVGDMKKRVYDPDKDGLIALAQLVAAVCSETEADGKITTHAEGSAHRWTDEKLRKGAGAAADPDEIDVLVSGLDVGVFQVNPGTGTMSTPESANNNSVVDAAVADAVDEYVEFDLPGSFYIRQFRHYGNAVMNGNGRWKIQYWDGDAWQDWETGIVQRNTNDWSDWTFPAAGIKLTTKIRLVCTTVDTAVAESRMNELEIMS